MGTQAQARCSVNLMKREVPEVLVVWKSSLAAIAPKKRFVLILEQTSCS
jgi:hypothetical protein